ncbi:hypothetical protein C8J56DRAFT_814806 [Mycena floridula]|nr:hypothetical protein C8J56DRAFT_814806 [Mycena floridula]
MYANLPDLVIREVKKNIWTFSRPFARFGIVPVGGRSTAVKLDAGDVWVLASTPLTEDTKSTLDNLGPVKYIMAGDIVHHIYLGEFKKAYPDAKVIGMEGLAEKKAKEGLKLDGAYGSDPAGTLYGFEDEIKSCYFSGFMNKDVAWYHVASKSLIVADLVFNLPGTEQYSKSTAYSSIPLTGKMGPSSWLHQKFLWGAGTDKEAMAKDAKTVAEWDFERIIMCHGDVIETDAKKAWKDAFASHLT